MVQVWCDLCLDRDPDAPLVVGKDTVLLTVSMETDVDRTVYEVDLCESHLKEVTGLAHAVRARGVPVTTPSTPVDDPEPTPKVSRSKHGGRTACPVCEMVLGHRSSATGHVWSQHIQMPRPQAPQDACPECGWDTHRSPAKIGYHRMQAHGHDPLVEALEVYRQMDRR